jgi:hypothetical protein
MKQQEEQKTEYKNTIIGILKKTKDNPPSFLIEVFRGKKEKDEALPITDETIIGSGILNSIPDGTKIEINESIKRTQIGEKTIDFRKNISVRVLKDGGIL